MNSNPVFIIFPFVFIFSVIKHLLLQIQSVYV